MVVNDSVKAQPLHVRLQASRLRHPLRAGNGASTHLDDRGALAVPKERREGALEEMICLGSHELRYLLVDSLVQALQPRPCVLEIEHGVEQLSERMRANARDNAACATSVAALRTFRFAEQPSSSGRSIRFCVAVSIFASAASARSSGSCFELHPCKPCADTVRLDASPTPSRVRTPIRGRP
jgi:hypothetical protein